MNIPGLDRDSGKWCYQPQSLSCLALPCLRGGQALTPAQRWGPMCIPKCNRKVTSSGYKAVVGCKAETSTKALVTCSKFCHGFGQLLVHSYPPDCRNLSGHQSKAPPPRQGGWPQWGQTLQRWTKKLVNFGPLTLEIRWLMFTYPMSSTCVLRMLMHLTSAHVILLPGILPPPEFSTQLDLRRQADSRWALPQFFSVNWMHIFN